MGEREDIDQTSDSDDEVADLHELAEEAEERSGLGDDLGDVEERPPQPGVTPRPDPGAE
jgi:hypothetical protein